MEGRLETWGQDEEGKDMQSLVWEVKEVEGVAAATQPAQADPVAIALNLLHGKTMQEFAEKALQDPVLRQKAASIYDSSMVSGLIAAGKIELKDGKHYVIGRKAEEIAPA